MKVLNVRNKTFKIELVNNYVRKLYIQMRAECDNITELVRDSEELLEEYQENVKEKDVDKKQLKKQYRKEHKELRNKLLEAQALVIELRNKILVEILEKNDINYDAEWWDRNTDVEDINNFIVECFNIGMSKKKVVKT